MTRQQNADSGDLGRAAVILLRHYLPLPSRELARRIKTGSCGTPQDNRIARHAANLTSGQILQILRGHDARLKRLAA